MHQPSINENSQKTLLLMLITFAALLFSVASFAQLPTGTFLGVVKDSSGAVVPEAKLAARNVDTGQTRSAVSGADGSFRFPGLPVGSYEIRAEQSGFATQVRTGLTLDVGQEAVVNFSMGVGAVEQTVSVSAEAPLVNTTSGTLGGLVDEEKVADLPLNGRNYVDLGLMQLGVSQDNINRGGSTGGPVMVGTWFSSNGAPSRSNNFMLDGAILQNYNNATTAGSSGSTLGVEGVREFRLVTNSFSAEYGMRMGGQMTIVSKSGTNAYHGSAYEYFRNSTLDARNFFDRITPTNPRRLPAFTRNQFGASFGGPIKKDKTFFYGVFESLRERLGKTIISTTLSPTQKIDGGAGGVAQISPVVKPYVDLFPNPNLSGNRYTFPFTQPTNEYYGQMRVDQALSSKDSMFARYTGDDDLEVLPLAFEQYTDNRLSRSQFTTVSDDHIFSPAVLNTTRVSFSRTKLSGIFSSSVQGPNVSFVPGLPIGTLAVTGLSSLGGAGTEPSISIQGLYTISDDVFLTKSKHAIKFGTLMNHFRQSKVQGQNYRGSVNFAGVTQFLTGQPTSETAVTPGTTIDRDYRFWTYGFYVQDDWKATTRLTLNIGLRYEFATVPTERFGRESNIRDLQHDATFTVGPVWKNNSLHNFGPRFGFALDPFGDGKTSVRGGFGLLYDIANLNSLRDLGSASAPPFSSQSSLLGTSTSPLTLTVPFVFPAGATGKSIRPVDYNVQQPHMLQYSMTVERQLPYQMALSIGYAGSRGIHIPLIMEGNPTLPQGVPTVVNGQLTCVPSATPVPFSPNAPKCWTGSDPRTNPNWGPIEYGTTASSTWYNALQVGLQKRITRGLQFQGNYTYSKVIDETSGEVIGDSSIGPPDPSNIKLDHAPAGYDVTHNFRLNAIYHFPSSSGTGFLAGLRSGWWTSSIVSLQSGYPITLRLGANRSRSGADLGGGFGTTTDRPDVLPGRDNSNITSGTTAGCQGVQAGQKLGTADLYYDPCAFAIPAAGFLGNAGRSILRGPGTATLDLSLVKDTALRFLGEGGKLEFRADAFNILNHSNLAPAASWTGVTVFSGTQAVEAPVGTAAKFVSTSTTSRQIQLALKILF